MSAQQPEISNRSSSAIPLREFLLISLDKNDLELRMAAFYVIACFLIDNTDAQIGLAEGIRLCASSQLTSKLIYDPF